MHLVPDIGKDANLLASLLFSWLGVVTGKAARVGGLGIGVEQANSADLPLEVGQLRVKVEGSAALMLFPLFQRKVGFCAVTECFDWELRAALFLFWEGAADKENQVVLIGGMRLKGIDAFWMIDNHTIPK